MVDTFALVPDEALRRVTVSGKVPPDVEAKLEALGRELGDLPGGVRGGKSAALNAILEMATYLGWFDNPDKFHLELLKAQAAAMERKARKK